MRKILLLLAFAMTCFGAAKAQDLPSLDNGDVPQLPGVADIPTTPEAQTQTVGGAGGGTGGGMVLSAVIASIPDMSVGSTLKFSPSGVELLDPNSLSDSIGGAPAMPGRASSAGLSSRMGSALNSGSAAVSGAMQTSGSSFGHAGAAEISGREGSGVSAWKVSGFGARPESLISPDAQSASAAYRPYSPYQGTSAQGLSSTGLGRGADQLSGSVRSMSAGTRSGTLSGQQAYGAQSSWRTGYQDRTRSGSTGYSSELTGGLAGGQGPDPLAMPGLDFGDAAAMDPEQQPESSIQTPGAGYQPYFGRREESGRRGSTWGSGERESGRSGRSSLTRDPRGRMASNSSVDRWARLHPSAQRLRQRRDLRSRERTPSYP